MRLLVSGATGTLRRYNSSPYLGALIVPGAGNRINVVLDANLPWAADNAAFVGFDPAAFCSMLGRVAGKSGCRFVACPDVVADAIQTRDRFRIWQPIITSLGQPVALVLQDGQEKIGVPWDIVQAVFVGGSTEFKLGRIAAELVLEAKERGKWVHLGRCNTRKRFRYAYQLGCDSVDGSGFSRWPDQRIPLALRWLVDLHGVSSASVPLARTEFFRGGLEDTVFGGSGWSLTSVREEKRWFRVEAEFRCQPKTCPQCGGNAAQGTRLLGHGLRKTTVADLNRHGLPVQVVITRQRFRCGSCGCVFAPHPPELIPGFRMSSSALEVIVASEQSSEKLASTLGVTARTVRRIRAKYHTQG